MTYYERNREEDRVVERTNDENKTLGFLANDRAHCSIVERERCVLGLRPLLKAGERVLYFSDTGVNVHPESTE